MAAPQNLCLNCQVRPKYYDVAAQKQHDFCSRTCANTNNNDKCEHCQSRPKYRDSTKTHAFCGKGCAQAAKAAGGLIPPRSQTLGSPPGSVVCSIPGCQKQVYKDANGKASKYCSRAHQGLGETSCLNCHISQRAAKAHLCQACKVSVCGNAPSILEIPAEHETYKSVVSQFRQSWRHATPCPTVQVVYKIFSTQQNLDKYEAYRSSVESRGNFVKAGMSFGNEKRRWHGTLRECTLGDKGCTQTFGKNTKWGRYGTGIYTSSTSSKSNDYSQNGLAAAGSPWKAMLLNKVVVGKGYKIKTNDDKLTAPPTGHDSVIGEVGVALNYDELVVYDNDAVRPSYLVMYEK